MKQTPTLCSIHNLYRMMRNQWKVARKRQVQQTAASAYFKENNIEVMEANDYVATPKQQFDFSSIVGLAPMPIPKNSNHPLYKEKPCYMFRDNNVLLEGLHQALVLTNTVQIEPDTLPPQIETLVDSVQLANQDDLVQRCIKSSCIYDAYQERLPNWKDPARPAWKFNCDYGITEFRKNRLLCNRLVQLCSFACPDLPRAVLHNVPISVPMLYDTENVQFEVRSDVLLTTSKPLSPLVSQSDVDIVPLPELSISHPTISLEEDNFYTLRDVFPIKEGAKFSHAHTMFIHYNPTEVFNLHETPVTIDQIWCRSLIKTYAAALAQARYTYGPDVKDIPKPIVIQSVQTDGRCFYFSVLQMNSVDVTSSKRNVFWNLPPMNLYGLCAYEDGVPVLQEYNPQVFKYILSFYANDL